MSTLTNPVFFSGHIDAGANDGILTKAGAILNETTGTNVQTTLNNLQNELDELRSEFEINPGTGGGSGSGGNVSSLSSGNLVVLKSTDNLSTILEANKTYEIRDEFDLTGRTINIPENCTLSFRGGSFRNGAINLNNVYVEGKPIFNGCNLSGTFLNPDVYFNWFNPSLSVNSDNSALLEMAISCSTENLLIETVYPLANTVNINKRITLKGVSSAQGIYANMTQNGKQGFRMTACKTAFNAQSNCYVSMYNLVIIGVKDLYTGGNIRITSGNQGTFTDKDQFGITYSINVVAPEGGVSTAGISLPLVGGINIIRDCSICGFTYGIYAIGANIDRVENNYFSACRWGLHIKAYTSDIMLNNNKFNTCCNDYNYKAAVYNGATTDISNMPEYLKEVGGGVYLRGTGMVQLNNNRFEFNFIQIVLDEADFAVQIQNNMFDKATCAHILVFNGNESAFLSQNPDHRERFQPAFNGILIDGNTFLRGANIQSGSGSVSTFRSVAGEAIFYIKHALESSSSGFTEDKGYSEDRGCILTLNNNVVTDFNEVDQSITSSNIHYQNAIFKFLNGGNGLIINSTGNDFTNTKSTELATFINGSSGHVYFNDYTSNFGALNHAQWHDILVLKKIEVNGSTLTIFNTQSDGNTVSQDYTIDLTNISSSGGGSGSGSESGSQIDAYTKAEVDSLLSNLVIQGGSNPFATGTVILISGAEANLSSLLNQQNKFFLIKGDIDLQNSNFTTAQGSYYYYMGSTISNCGNIYISNNSTIDGCKINGFKEIVLGTNAVLKNCDCNGLLHSRGIWIDGDEAKVLNNNIYNITDYEYQGSLLTTAAIRSHRYVHRAVTDGVYIKNVQIKGNTFKNIKPIYNNGVTNKLCVMYLNEVYAEIFDNTIIGFGDPDKKVAGTTDKDVDGIHLQSDNRFSDFVVGSTDGYNTFTPPYGYGATPVQGLGADAAPKQILTIVKNNVFRECTFLKSIFKIQASDIVVQSNTVTWDNYTENIIRRCYATVRVNGGSNVSILDNTFFLPKSKAESLGEKENFCIRCARFENLVVRNNVWTYSCPDLTDTVVGENSPAELDDAYNADTWYFYDSQFQLGWHLDFSNNKIYVKNRSNILSWQSIKYAKIANNYFNITDHNPGSNLFGTYDNISVNGFDPTVYGGDVLFENNYIHCWFITKTIAASQYVDVAISQTMKFIMKNNYFKVNNNANIRLKLYNITGLEAVFDSNVFDGGNGYISCATNTGNIAAQGNANVPDTWQIIKSIDVKNMELFKIDIHDVTSLNISNVKLKATTEPITLKNVTNLLVLNSDLYDVTSGNYICKVSEGSCSGYIDCYSRSTYLNTTGNSSSVSIKFKNASTSGTTANRPTNVVTGFVYYDTTIGSPVIWNGSSWTTISGSGGAETQETAILNSAGTVAFELIGSSQIKLCIVASTSSTNLNNPLEQATFYLSDLDIYSTTEGCAIYKNNRLVVQFANIYKIDGDSSGMITSAQFVNLI